MSANSYQSVLRSPRFLQLWGAQFLGQISQNVVNFALIVLVNVQTGSTLAGGVLVILFSIPAILLGPLPGMLVDRVGRWWVLWLANLLRTLLGLGMGLALVFLYHGAAHGANGSLVVLLYLFSLSLSISTRFYMPAEATAIPSLVGLSGLTHGLALFGIAFVVAEALGLIVLGPILHLAFGWPSLFFACMAGFGLALLLSLLLPRRQLGAYHSAEGETLALAAATQDAALLAALDAGTRRQGIWQQLKEGWQVIVGDRQMLVAVVRLSLAGVVIALVSELAPNFVVQVLHRPADQISLVLAPAGVALIVGAIIAPRLARKMGSLPSASLGVNGVVLAVVLLALNRPLGDFVHLPDGLIIALAVVEASLLGFALNLISIPCQAVIQERVLPRLRGSMVAFQQALFNLAAVPILVVIGLLADDLGIPWALLAVAIIALLAARLYAGEKPGPTAPPGQPAQVAPSPDSVAL